MLEIAFGQMGMSPAEFWRMSWRDFQLKQQGFFEMKNEEYKLSWTQARFIAFYAASGFLKKGTKMKDLIRFDWERDDAIELTDDQIQYWLNKVGHHIDKDGRGYNA